MSPQQAFDLAAALPGVTEKDHFGQHGFWANKRMFITIWVNEKRANLRLSLDDQKLFLQLDGEAFAEIDNAWGRQGWTTVNLEFIERSEFRRALDRAYEYSREKIPATTTKWKKGKKKAPIRRSTRKKT